MVTVLPDQTFWLYLEANRWLAAAGPIHRLPPKTATGLSGASNKSRKPYVVLAVNASSDIIKGRGWKPTEAEIGGLEASLPLVSQLIADNWLPQDLRVAYP